MQVSSQPMATLGSFCRPMKVVYPASAVRGRAGVCGPYLREHWTKIAVAIIGGVLAGFFAGVVSSREYLPLAQVVYAAGAPATRVTNTASLQPPSAEAQRDQAAVQEVSRLRAENQQLQALVVELQKERPAAHSRKARAHHRRHSSSRSNATT